MIQWDTWILDYSSHVTGIQACTIRCSDVYICVPNMRKCMHKQRYRPTYSYRDACTYILFVYVNINSIDMSVQNIEIQCSLRLQVWASHEVVCLGFLFPLSR